jgi:hypothetical protein
MLCRNFWKTKRVEFGYRVRNVLSTANVVAWRTLRTFCWCLILLGKRCGERREGRHVESTSQSKTHSMGVRFINSLQPLERVRL